MKKLILLIVAFAGLQANAQMTLNEVTLAAKLKVDQSELVLNGGGIRKKVFFKVYVAGMYLPQKSKNAESIINAEQEMAVRLQITSSVVSSSNMSESIREGFNKSTKGNVASLNPKINVFISTFAKEAIKEGDVFTLFYKPGEGVKAYKNDKLQNTIPGADFKKALFGIWLGADPVDGDLKKGLLGQ